MRALNACIFFVVAAIASPCAARATETVGVLAVAPPPGPGPELVELAVQLRQVMAERMTLSFQTTPHFYLTSELDATALLALKERLAQMAADGPGVTVSDILVKLVAAALRASAFANAAWRDGAVEHFDQVNIGLATATEHGLVVPVIQEADRQTFREIAQQRQGLLARAREGRLSLEDISGGTFTLSNLGMYGVDQFAGIINPPQAALLAVGRIKPRPYGLDGKIKLRPTLFATLSVDHRVMDGAQGAALLERLAALIEQPALLVA